jgi:hypothetical protein
VDGLPSSVAAALLIRASALHDDPDIQTSRRFVPCQMGQGGNAVENSSHSHRTNLGTSHSSDPQTDAHE